MSCPSSKHQRHKNIFPQIESLTNMYIHLSYIIIRTLTWVINLVVTKLIYKQHTHNNKSNTITIKGCYIVAVKEVIVRSLEMFGVSEQL